jgi:hypothetical protein
MGNAINNGTDKQLEILDKDRLYGFINVKSINLE